MLRYIIVRLVWICIVLVTFLSILFVTIRIVPEYPPTEKNQRDIYYAKQKRDGYMYTEVIDDPSDVAAIKNGTYEKCDGCYYKEETDQYRVYIPVPIANQYVSWIKNLTTRFDWGQSTRVSPNVDVFDIMQDKLPHTMKLNFLSLLFFMPTAFILGIIAALKKNKLADNIISLGIMIFISVPGFVVMLLHIVFFAYQVDLFPSQYPASDASMWIQIQGFVLPVLALSYYSIAAITRLTRAELTEVLTSDFLLLARTKGLTKRQAVIRHAMRNSLVPLVPAIIFSFVGLISGSIIIENIYAIPGMGRLYLEALTLNSFDFNLILALSAFYTSIALFAVLIVDLSYGIVDPRIRMGARK